MHTPYLLELQALLQWMVEVLAAGVWGGCEGVQLSSCLAFMVLLLFNVL